MCCSVGASRMGVPLNLRGATSTLRHARNMPDRRVAPIAGAVRLTSEPLGKGGTGTERSEAAVPRARGRSLWPTSWSVAIDLDDTPGELPRPTPKACAFKRTQASSITHCKAERTRGTRGRRWKLTRPSHARDHATRSATLRVPHSCAMRTPQGNSSLASLLSSNEARSSDVSCSACYRHLLCRVLKLETLVVWLPTLCPLQKH